MEESVQRLTEQTQHILVLWVLDLLSSDDVMDWLNAKVLEFEALARLPEWFLTLAEHGPRKCAAMSSREFDFPWLGYAFPDYFAAQLRFTDLADSQSLASFIHKVAIASHGEEDFRDPTVALSLTLDHLAFDRERMDLAIAEARAALPSVRGECQRRVADLFKRAGLQPR